MHKKLRKSNEIQTLLNVEYKHLNIECKTSNKMKHVQHKITKLNFGGYLTPYTFPLAVYGRQDAFSGYILYLKLWTSNSDPKLIGRWHLEHLYKTRGANIKL